ncbi:ABC transporter permease [Thermodesulfovibrio hydrogeniphilus]
MSFKRALRVWQRHATVYKKLYRSSLALNFFEPLLYLIALGYGLGGFIKEINGLSYVEFIAPGIIMSSAMYAACYECTYGTYVRMEYQKTFDAILSTPISFNELVLGELLWGATKSLIYGTIIILVISFFGLAKSNYIVLVPLFIAICGLIFASLSLIATAIVPGIDSFNYFYTLILTPLFLFSGIFFPLEGMPDIVLKLSELNPLFHLVNISRGLCYGRLENMSPSDFYVVFVYILILLPLPFILLKKRYLR